MEEAGPGGEDRPDGVPPGDAPGGGWPAGAAPAASDPLAAEAAEVRQLVEAGASSPEELRALAARLKELREREEARWRSEVKPALLKEKKGRLRRTAPEPPPPVLPEIVPPPGPMASAEPAPPLPAAWPTPPSSLPAQPGPMGPSPSRALWIGIGLLVMVGLALMAANTTIWVLLLPVLGLLAWAWVQGQRPDDP